MIQQKDIPKKEIDYFLDEISKQPEYLDTSFVKNKYVSYGLTVDSNPFSNSNSELILNALINQKPLSVIRIGDGEANFLTYGQYPKTPTLNQFAFEKIVHMQQDNFNICPEWMVYLQNCMMSAILQADIVGVIGLWRAGNPTVETMQDSLVKDPRGISGHWRSVDYLLRLAKLSYINEKHIVSAHLYLSILENLKEIFQNSKKTYIINNNLNVFNKLENNFDHEFIYIPVGQTQNSRDKATPSFLYKLYKQLPASMEGTLTLVGAGPWSEIYCTWIKQKGGVAVDIGSGFDLLQGKVIRPVHKLLNFHRLNPYKL